MSRTRYIIEYDFDVREKLKKFPKTIQQRILNAIESRLAIAPNEYGKSLQYNLKNHRRLRVGDYRIIYRVIEAKILVLIVEIDHRKNVYED